MERQIEDLREAISEKAFEIPKSALSCIPSLRVPEKTLNPAYVGLKVFRIKWT